jgi:hypothetical protein
MRRKPARRLSGRRPDDAASRREMGRATLREACRVFERDLAREEQLRVAEEIVLTRAEELCLAYPNVLHVTFGHRRVRDKRSKRHRVVPTPCVRFLVARKWPKGRKKRVSGRIPGHLLAFCVVGGERRLCAVSTDVEDVRIHSRIRAQGTAVAAIWNGTSEFGTIACAVQRDVLPDRIYGVSCRHVLSLSAKFFDETTWGAQVQVQTAATSTIGPTRAIAGSLGAADSFDAQLVEATNREALRSALGSPVPVQYARGVAELPARYDIHTPSGTIEAAFVDFPPEPGYDVGGHRIGHRTIVQSQPEEGTNAGTSGSPVISKDGRTLLGMHVAGKAEMDPQGHFIAVSYMIPAWELLNPANYANASNQETWALVTP